MTAPRHICPQLLTAVYAMGGRRQGKTHVMEQLSRSMRGVAASFVVIDEYAKLYHDELKAHRLPRNTGPDRSHFERGGRYRKPPIASNARPPASGMVQVRDRAGHLVWRKLGEGQEALRMRDLPGFGTF